MVCCTDCDFKSQVSTNVRNHIEAHHAGLLGLNYYCSFCCKNFKSKNSFQSHKSRSKGRCSQLDVISFFCGNILLTLYTLSDLEEEISQKMVRLVEGWQCQDCLWTTKYKTRLWEHIESKHVQSQGYNCGICLKFCSSKHALHIHKSRYHKGVTF